MTATPAFRFGRRESTVRRVAAGLSLVVSLGINLCIGALADSQYENTLIAMAQPGPVTVALADLAAAPDTGRDLARGG